MSLNYHEPVMTSEIVELLSPVASGVIVDATYGGDGLRVADVIPDGPADKPDSRLEQGDIVLQVNDRVIASGADLTRALTGEYPRDDVLRVARRYLRSERTVKVSVGRSPV